MGNLCAPAAEPPTPNPADDESYSPPLGAPAEGNPIGDTPAPAPATHASQAPTPLEAETPESGHPEPLRLSDPGPMPPDRQ